MTRVLYIPMRSDVGVMAEFASRVQAARPDIEFYTDPAEIDYATVDVLLGWGGPKGVFPRLTNLKAIIGTAAGVNAFLDNPELPKHVPLTRIVTPALTRQMNEFVVFHVLRLFRRFDELRVREDQPWAAVFTGSPADVTVGILGFGSLGQAAAKHLLDFGFRVIGWSKSKKKMSGVTSFTEDELDTFLGQSQILVNLLPLTEETCDLIDADFLAKLPKGAAFINAARGKQVVEEDLVAALDSGHIREAALDVFRTEPLPRDNPLFSHRRVYGTPHIAGLTTPEVIIDQVLENLRRYESGQPLLNLVDRDKGY